MAYGLEVTVIDTLDGSKKVHTIRKSAVRIGRNTLNDLHVDSAFVSQFHAVVEHDGQHLVLRDLGSTNGSIVQGERLSNGARPLVGNPATFSVLNLQFHIRAVPLDLVPQAKSSRKPLQVTGLLAAPPAELLQMLEERSVADPEEEKKLHGLYEDYRKAWATLMTAMGKATLARSPGSRGGFVTKLSADFPAVSQEPDFHRLAADAGCERLTIRDSATEERIAIEGLREIALDYVPGSAPPESSDEVVRFLTRIRETLDVFFKAFIPLRDGQRQFRQDLGIQAPAPLNDRAEAVERAANPPELSAALLGPKSSSDALGHVESTFADMMIHHVAMLNGVMTGVKGILHELAPETIRAALEQGSSREVFGMSLGGAGPKQLWAEFQKRHGDIAEEEKQLFKLLFGRQFSVAYSAAASNSAPEPGRSRSTVGWNTTSGESPGAGSKGTPRQ